MYFLMGLWGGARGLWSHLDESSIFKMNLIESRSPLRPRVWNLFKLFPLTPVTRQTSLTSRQSFPSSGIRFALSWLHGAAYV